MEIVSMTVSEVYVVDPKYLRCVNPKFHPNLLVISKLSSTPLIFLVKS
jgi:hypothetical protein